MDSRTSDMLTLKEAGKRIVYAGCPREELVNVPRKFSDDVAAAHEAALPRASRLRAPWPWHGRFGMSADRTPRLTALGAALDGIGQINVIIEPLYGAVAAKVVVLLLVIAFIQRRPEGLFAPKGRR
jgi:hypothetical protein